MWADLIERRIALELHPETTSQDSLESDNSGHSSNASTIAWTNVDDADSALDDSVWTSNFDRSWEPSKIHLITFTRSPASLCTALHKGRELECVRVTAAEYGQSCRLPSGTSIFVHPQHYEGIKKLASALGLLPYHAIVSEAFLPMVYEEIAKLRSKDNVRIRRLQKMALVDSNDAVICFLQQTFMHTSDNKDTHGIPNPRALM